MRCVIQRVVQASVSVAGEQIGAIQQGFMVLIGVSTDDTDYDVHYMAEKVPNLRIFEDEAGKMNRSLKDVGGAILAVSQFTLYGDARGGRRPSFIAAARPEEANERYEQLVAAWRAQGIHVETGRFRADMQVSLELPEQYLLGDDPAVYAVYTIRGGTKQESTSVKVPAKISGMADLLAQSTGAQLASSGDVAPGRSAWMLAGISLGCTAAAAVVTVLVMRLVNRIRRKKRRRSRPGPRHGN